MQDTVPSRVRFAGFEFDLRTGELRGAEQTVRLSEKPYRILAILLEHAGELVTRDELRSKLWPNDTVVDFEHGINTAIRKLRDALGESAEAPQYIETLPRQGYRLIVPVEPLTIATNPLAEVVTAPMRQPDATLLIGKKIAHYRVLEILGGGGMGMVYKAEDLKLGRAVALKFLPEELASDPGALKRFEREARMASALNHPNICTIHHVEEYEQQPVLIMELLEGQTLRDRLAALAGQQKKLPLDESLNLAIQICDGLQAAHEKAIVHRDIKPANIFITSKGVVKILDFGLAKLVSAAKEAASDGLQLPTAYGTAPQPARADETVTWLGNAMGTAGYMSPEQIRGEKLDTRTDIFSFGLVLYEMATGRRAFCGDTAAVVHNAIVHKAPLPLRELNPKLPARLVSTIDKALEKDRERRWQSAAEIRAALQALQGNSKPHSRTGWWVAFGTLLLILLVSAGAVLTGRIRVIPWNSAKLAEKDTILLSDFSNRTPDPVFNDTLRQALGIQVEQSPFLNLLPEQQITETLKLMTRTPGEPLTPDVAREVCVRSNSKAVLSGSIAAVGEHFLVAAKAVNCRTGKTLASAKSEASNRNQVLKSVQEIGNQIRIQLGETKRSAETLNQPLEEATTSSLEALQAFTLGTKQFNEGGAAAAVPHFKRAVDIDPNFALAYVWLAAMSGNLSQDSEAVKYGNKAYQLRDRVSRRERLSIEQHYYMKVTGELDKCIQMGQEWAQLYPNDYIPHNEIAVCYLELGQYEKAIPEALRGMQLAPGAVAPPVNLMTAYLFLGRLDEAAAVYDRAHARGLKYPGLPLLRYQVAFLQKDNTGMQRILAERATSGEGEDFWLDVAESSVEAYYGHLSRARRILRAGVDSAKNQGISEAAAMFLAGEALCDAELGNAEVARKEANEALRLSTGRRVMTRAALALARAGDPYHALQIARQLDGDYPLDTTLQSYDLPAIRGATKLARDDVSGALADLQQMGRYDLERFEWRGYLPYLHGLVYMQGKQGEKAAAELRRLTEHPAIVATAISGPLSHLQLARAQLLMGDKSAAGKSYEKFLTTWKDADPDIPIYKQAKAEYAKLR